MSLTPAHSSVRSQKCTGAAGVCMTAFVAPLNARTHIDTSTVYTTRQMSRYVRTDDTQWPRHTGPWAGGAGRYLAALDSTEQKHNLAGDCHIPFPLCVSEWSDEQSDRSCQVLKWIIGCLWSEAYERDELKIQPLQEHLGSRRISEEPLIAEQRPLLKGTLPSPVAPASREATGGKCRVFIMNALSPL